MEEQRPIEDQQPTEPQPPEEALPGAAGDAGERQRADLGEAWRRAGTALGDMGTDVGASVRQAWDAAGPETDAEHPGDSLRRLADVVERSVTTARNAATSPEARQRLNEGAKEANDAIERAVRLSLAELGKALQRLEPKDEAPPDKR